MGDDNNDTAKKFTPEQLAMGIAYTIQEVKKMSEQVTALTSRVDTMHDNFVPPKSDDDDSKEEEVNLDELSGAALGEAIMGQIKSKLIDPLKGYIDDVEGRRAQRDADTEIKEATGRYMDFKQWDNEIAGIVKDMPNISLDDAYTLARARNPEKTKQIDDSIAQKRAAEEKGKEDEQKGRPFGGLLPTSSPRSDNTGMTLDDAGEAAWESTMADFDSLIQGGGGSAA